MNFANRYKTLNSAQKEAVDLIDGPVMVIAGPGTGKTELLSMRAANILKQTDTLPSNILCLTFTDSGAAAMRQRLSQIIGPDAYRVAIHTFHSFGADIIGRHGQFFYRGADFQPANELATYEIIRGIFSELDHTSPIASTMNGEYTHLKDALSTISDLKRSGLTDDELLVVLDANDTVIERAESELSNIFAQRITASTLALLTPVATIIAEIDEPQLPPEIPTLSSILSLSLAHAVDEAVETNSTKPITAWRNKWMQKDDTGSYILKARSRQIKLRAMSRVYYQYLLRMQEAQLYDFDDMILQVAHAMEIFPELCYNLQEQYQYIMVDEFQDTNLAQMRILRNLTDSEAHNGQPNILVVGDDDQAIYSFQGADISNVMNFRSDYPEAHLITLTNNYRSGKNILEAARKVISQGDERLENYHEEINKQLTANQPEVGQVQLVEANTLHSERQAIASAIADHIANGVKPEAIAVLARRHHELVDLLPYLIDKDIRVSYEHQDDVLEDTVIQSLELLATIIVAIQRNQLDTVNSLLPQLIAHQAFDFDSKDVWKLSLSSYDSRRPWLDLMLSTPVFASLAEWLIEAAKLAHILPLEQILDYLIGKIPINEYSLPFYQYYFELEKIPAAAFVAHLNALRTIRTKLREHDASTAPTLADFLDFITLHRVRNARITHTTPAGEQVGAIHLMTAHKSKGLEFDYVYIIGAIDSSWGQTVRSRSRLIGYPENLPLMIAGNTADERLRLFFVAMTRARLHLTISYSLQTDSGKALSLANFLLPLEMTSEPIQSIDSHGKSDDALAWYAPLVTDTADSLKTLLTPTLERYMLSATDLGNFIDVTRGGPQTFLLNSLLKFPQAMSPHASYGSAIHSAIQQAHNHLRATGERRPIEDLLGDFTTSLERYHLTPEDYQTFLEKGTDSLQRFLAAHYNDFTPNQKAEMNFAHQHVILDGARLNGKLDLVDINKESNTITVTDYKTGKPSRNWTGKTDYEKIKLHKYKYQLMFYKLLIEHSRDWSNYTVTSGVIQFVEPAASGDIVALELSYSEDELERFKQLIAAVWNHITTLTLPDISSYDPSYKGLLAFEDDLLQAK